MTNRDILIDFAELGEHGEALEGMVRELGIALGLNPIWSGRGPDNGKDVVFTERLVGPIRTITIRWLVSCKDKAISERSVTPELLPQDIRSKLEMHKAQGFLLVTTTTPSVRSKTLLDANDIMNGGNIYTQVWDATTLRQLLMRPQHATILKHFLPKSFRKVTQLSAPDGTLCVFKDEVPTEVLLLIETALEPYHDGSLLGRIIWPGCAETAGIIDAVVKFLAVDKDVSRACNAAAGLGVDEIVVTIREIAKKYPREAVKLAEGVAEQTASAEVLLNLAQFMVDSKNWNLEILYVSLVRLADEGFDDLSDLLFPIVCQFADNMYSKDTPEEVRRALPDYDRQAKVEGFDIDELEGAYAGDGTFELSARGCTYVCFSHYVGDYCRLHVPTSFTARLTSQGLIVASSELMAPDSFYEGFAPDYD
jgi:hypothetical protein